MGFGRAEPRTAAVILIMAEGFALLRSTPAGATVTDFRSFVAGLVQRYQRRACSCGCQLQG